MWRRIFACALPISSAAYACSASRRTRRRTVTKRSKNSRSVSLLRIMYGYSILIYRYMLLPRSSPNDTVGTGASASGAARAQPRSVEEVATSSSGSSWLRTTFRSLRVPNYRLYAAGALVSNVGTWMQRTAQDWLVLTQLTHRNATAVGIVMALQFGPQVLLLPLTGYAADHFNRRKLLFATQSLMGALALGLGILTITGLVQLWHVYLFALLLGCAAAFDAPARQTFVSELVGEAELSNAVALNSTSFHAGRLIGPAISGLLVAAVGTGWMFVLNGVSF